MKITRIYNDKNGDSHFGEVEIPLAHQGEIGFLSENFSVNSLQFRKVSADYDYDFTFGAWVQDVILGLKNLTKWNRIAIVTDQKGVQNFTEIVSVLMPGEVKSYPVEFLAQAILWCAQGNEQED